MIAVIFVMDYDFCRFHSSVSGIPLAPLGKRRERFLVPLGMTWWRNGVGGCIIRKWFAVGVF